MSFSLKAWQEGQSADSWKYFGCHIENGTAIFRIWAPGAKSVSVTGLFTGWREEGCPTSEILPGIFECKIPNLEEYTPYKFVVSTSDGQTLFKSDPFAMHTETPPRNASKIYTLPEYSWNDSKWMGKRSNHMQPVNIYQIHAGSFRTYAGGEPLNYRKLGEELGPYLKHLGCTHLGLMPLQEHQEEGGFPCKTTGFFALTSRYGVPQDFCRLIEQLHQLDIGVTLDVDFLGFPKDDFGLSSFIGSPLWESETDGGSCYFDFERPEVQSFLLSSAHFLLETFHLDGLRFLCTPEICARPGGRAFLEKLLENLRTAFPEVHLIGEDEELPFTLRSDNSTAASLIRRASGLPEALVMPKPGRLRQADLPLTREESFINRMQGSYDEKFARLRAAAAFFYALPGAKLVFMGNEFAQFTAWDYRHELDWILLDYEMHRKYMAMVLRTADFYRKTPAIWDDTVEDGRFAMIRPEGHPGVYGFIRREESGSEIIVLSNFTDQPISPLVLGVEKRGKYAEIFSSDEMQYGGEGRKCNVNFAKLRPADGKPFCIEPELAPFTTVYFYKSAGTAPGRKS